MEVGVGMKLYHKVIGTLADEHAKSIEIHGLIPYVATAYKDLVPENIIHLPVIWLSERIKNLDGLPIFEVDTKDLDQSNLYHTEIIFEADKDLPWWVYQGAIQSQYIRRIANGYNLA